MFISYKTMGWLLGLSKEILHLVQSKRNMFACVLSNCVGGQSEKYGMQCSIAETVENNLELNISVFKF